MSGLASAVVRLAARTLPAAIRDRYREQWLADIRDAEEAGIRPAEIAVGSLAFALSAPRPVERRRTEPNVEGRARLASALALSCAVVGVSQFGNPGSGEGLTGNAVYDFMVAFSTALLLLFLVLAPIVALVLVTATRRMPGRVRAAVWLLVGASLTGIPLGLIDSIREAQWLPNTLLTESVVALLVALVLGAIGCLLLARHWGQPARQRRRPLIALTSTVAALALLGLGVANVLVLRQQLRAADIAFVNGLPDGTVDAVMLAQGAQSTTVAISAWVAIALLGCLGVGVAVYLRPRHAIVRLLAFICLLLISHAGLLTFVWLNSFGGPGVHLTVPESVLLLVGRWGFIAIVLYSIGGVRYRRRPALGSAQSHT